MTEYRINCHTCTNKAFGDNGSVYCLPTRELHSNPVYIEPGHAGTKEDPDPICCDYYTERPMQMRIIQIEGTAWEVANG